MTECWIWGHSIGHHGYGTIWNGKKNLMAHRVVYEALIGRIPKGLTLDHLCKNTACINPEHLEPVTLRENILRGNGPAAQNSRKKFCIRGHRLSGDNLYSNNNQRICRQCKEYWRLAHPRITINGRRVYS